MKKLLNELAAYQLYIRMGLSALSLLLSFLFDGLWEIGLSLFAFLVVGLPIFWSALRRILQKEWLDETFLMSIAAIGAFAIGEYAEAVAVMLFYLIGEQFEARSVRKARRLIRGLMDIHPDSARVERDGVVVEIESEEVLVGDTVLIRGGERVPTDGVIIEGNAFFDTSAITGESFPLEGNTGVALFGGMLCQSGHVKMKCTRICEESAASRILQLVSEAQDRKSKQETFISSFARVYTPIVVAIAVMLAVFPPLIWGSFSQWLHTALVFLVVSCPCALLISVPLSFFGGIGGGASVGILFKGGMVFEALAKCKTAVFDKTGTLTSGQLSVANIITEDDTDANEILTLAASLEQLSAHPMAKGVLKKAEGMPLFTPTDYVEVHGKGVMGKIEENEIVVGNRLFLEEKGIALPESYDNLQILVAKNGQLLGGILMEDMPRADAKEAIVKMKGLGIRKTVMLSGDKSTYVKKIAKELGIDSYEGELLPIDKYARLEALLEQGENVLFVGDGINDVPSLARADVGIAMGGIGSDAAIEAADIVLANDAPSQIPRAIGIARRTVSIAKANVIFALTVKFGVMLLSLTGLVPGIMWLAVFADVGVSVIAILNAMRCLHIK